MVLKYISLNSVFFSVLLNLSCNLLFAFTRAWHCCRGISSCLAVTARCFSTVLVPKQSAPSLCLCNVAFIASYPFTRSAWAVCIAAAVSSGGSGVCTGCQQRAGLALRCVFNPPGMLHKCCLYTHRLLRYPGC